MLTFLPLNALTLHRPEVWNGSSSNASQQEECEAML